MLEYDYLKSILHYEPSSGVWIWLVTKGNAMEGSQAGSIDKIGGYRYIKIDDIKYKSSRLAWFYMTKEWLPRNIKIDHKDTIRSNDIWINLRKVSQMKNTWNRNIMSTNKIGVKGVYVDKERKKYRVQIKVNGKRVFLGRFDDLEKASDAYKEAAIKYHGEFARW